MENKIMKKAYVFGILLLGSFILLPTYSYTQTSPSTGSTSHLKPASRGGGGIDQECLDPPGQGETTPVDINAVPQDTCPPFRVQIEELYWNKIIGLSQAISMDGSDDGTEGWALIDDEPNSCTQDVFLKEVDITLDFKTICTGGGVLQLPIKYDIVSSTPDENGVYKLYSQLEPDCFSNIFPASCFDTSDNGDHSHEDDHGNDNGDGSDGGDGDHGGDPGHTHDDFAVCLDCTGDGTFDDDRADDNTGDQSDPDDPNFPDQDSNGKSHLAINDIPSNTSDNQLKSKARNNQNTLLVVHPNPFTSNFSLEYLSDVAQESQVQVINLNGSIILNSVEKMDAGLNTLDIDLSQHPEGLYLLRIWNGKSWISTKALKIK
jgi:hypothetical protein